MEETLGGGNSGWRKLWVEETLGGGNSGWRKLWVEETLGGGNSGWRKLWVEETLGGGNHLGGGNSGWRKLWVEETLGGGKSGWRKLHGPVGDPHFSRIMINPGRPAWMPDRKPHYSQSSQKRCQQRVAHFALYPSASDMGFALLTVENRRNPDRVGKRINVDRPAFQKRLPLSNSTVQSPGK